MNSRKTFFAMIGLLVILIGALGFVIVKSNDYLKQQSDKLVAAKLDRTSLNEQQSALTKAKRDLEKYEELNKIAQSIVPQDKDQAKAVREIVTMANESGVTIKSITFDDSTLGQTAASTAPAGDGNNGTGQAAAAPKEEAPPITQAQPVEGISGVYSVPVTITSTDNNNSFANLLTFLSKLENNRRTAQVEQVNITSDISPTGQTRIDFVLIVNIFVKP